MKKLLPMEIEQESFAIISKEIGNRKLDPDNELVIKRVIHTSADFDYLDNLIFSKNVVKDILALFKEGVSIICDTTMVQAGINKKHLALLNSKTYCFIQDEDVAQVALTNKTTRSSAAIDKSLSIKGPKIYAIGNAPTALIRINELVKNKKLDPALVIALPVGFVNVIESKELIRDLQVPYIIGLGRKGGSNVAAACINALIYQALKRANE